MKQTMKTAHLSILTAGLGGIAFVLRLCLYAFGTDEKGLLIPAHPLEIGLWLICAAAVAVILLSLGKADAAVCSDTSSADLAAAGCFLFAAGVCYTVVTSRSALPALVLPTKVTGFLSAAALVWVGICRRNRQRPYFAFHAIVCVYLTLYTVCHYQIWSSRPQLQDSLLPMLGCILLMLFSYYLTASDVDMGKRRMQLGTGLLAGFAGIAAASGGTDSLLYLTGSLWALTNLGCSTFCKED